MKRALSIMALALAWGVTTPLWGQAPISWEEALRRKQASLEVLYINEALFCQRLNNGSLNGMEADLVMLFQQFLMRRYGITLNLTYRQVRTYTEMLEAVEPADSLSGPSTVSNPNRLGMGGISITPRRRTRYDFTPPYLIDVEILASSADVPLATEQNYREVFADVVALAGENTTFLENFRRIRQQYIPELKIESRYTSMADTRQALERGTRLITYIPLPLYLVEIQKNPLIRRQLLFRTDREGLAMILPKGSYWLVPFTEFMQQVNQNGQLRQIQQKYLGPDVTNFIDRLAQEGASAETRELMLMREEAEIQRTAITEEQATVRRGWYLLTGLGLLMMIGTAFGVVLYRANRYRKKANLELSLQKKAIEEKNAQLTHTLEELGQAQHQLVLAEKKATAGLLARNLAHQLNSPLAGLKASVQQLAMQKQNLSHHLPYVLNSWPQTQREYFKTLLSSSAVLPRPATPLTTRQEREVRRTLKALVEQWRPTPDVTDSLAETLLMLGYHTPEQVPPPPASMEWPSLAQALGYVANYRSSSDTIALASEKIIQALQTLQTAVAGGPDLARVPIRLQESLDDALAAYSGSLSHGITLHRHYEANPILIAPPEELELIWRQIITNAIQALAHQGELHVSLSQEGPQAIVRFTDNGPGIPTDLLPRVFEPFVTTRPGEGSGMGLYIVRMLAERLGGQAHIDSRPGHTSVSLHLPVTPAAAPTLA